MKAIPIAPALLVGGLLLAALILSAVFASISRELEAAAEDPGGSPLYVRRTVTFPLVTPAILMAGLLTFINAIADFGNPMLMGGGYQVLAPQAYIQMIELFDLQSGAVRALLLFIPALLAFALQHWITRKRSYVTVTSGARTGHIRKLPGWVKWSLAEPGVLCRCYLHLHPLDDGLEHGRLPECWRHAALQRAHVPGHDHGHAQPGRGFCGAADRHHPALAGGAQQGHQQEFVDLFRV